MQQQTKSWRPLELADIQPLYNEKYSQEWRVYLAAQLYAKAGIYVIPLQKNKKILPSSKTNVNYGSASRTLTTIEKWFHPENGIFKGWNIGIATGREDGILAVDIDRHGDKDGFVSLAALEEKNGKLPIGPVQKSPNGGKHYLFLWQENMINSTDKLGPGIDTRGGTAKACKGHIVVWPSVVDNKHYEWEKFCDIPILPKWIPESFGVPWQPQSRGTGRGNENIGIDDVEQQIPIKQVQRMLDSIDPNNLGYEEWLRIGMAIKSQYQGDDGLEVWDEWSKRGNKYKNNECHIRWSGFSDFGTVRMGTLWYYATEAGWEPTDEDKKASKYDVIVERMNKEFAIVTVGGKVRVIREKQLLSDPTASHYDLMGKDDFRTLLENERVVIADDRGQPRRVSVADLWLAHQARRTYPNGIALFPDGKPLPGYYNTWNGFSVEPREGDCGLFLTHIREIICNGDDNHYQWVLDWLSDAAQDPANPKGTCVVLRGDEGAGKGTLANTVGELFGSHYRHLIDDNHLLSNFNAHMIDALFVFADEITWGGNKKTAGKLKGMVTEKFLVGERKGVDAVGYRNMIRMIIASNASWVIPAGTNSRRWFVLDVCEDRINDMDYFNKIQDQLDNGGREALLHLLLNRKITNNLRRAPETEALHEQRQRSVNADNTILGWLIERIATGIMDVPSEEEFIPGESQTQAWPKYAKFEALYENYKEWCASNHRPEVITIFGMEIKKLGFMPRKLNRQKARIRCYEIPDIELLRTAIIEKHNITVGDDHENED